MPLYNQILGWISPHNPALPQLSALPASNPRDDIKTSCPGPGLEKYKYCQSVTGKLQLRWLDEVILA